MYALIRVDHGNRLLVHTEIPERLEYSSTRVY